jgi:hypothetical protein
MKSFDFDTNYQEISTPSAQFKMADMSLSRIMLELRENVKNMNLTSEKVYKVKKATAGSTSYG